MALAVGLHGAAAAEEPPRIPLSVLPGIGEADPRRPVDMAQPPWRAIGRVQLEIGGICTGALVAPRQVLTAAHCLVAQRTRSLVQPGTVHFMLGYDRGAAVAHARVVSYRIGPGYQPELLGPRSSDWAVLLLDQPVGGADRVLPLLRQPPEPRSPLMLGGYQQDRREVVLADTGCRVLGLAGLREGRPLLLHDCASTRGASGAPLLAPLPGGGWAIAGVASGMLQDVAMGQAVPAGAVSLQGS